MLEPTRSTRSMRFMEKLFALRRVPCFKGLDEPALTLIADVAESRIFAPGDRFADAGRCLQRLYVVIGGSIQNTSGDKMPGILGPASLLFGLSVELPLHASVDHGAACLVVAKAHFFTIVYQFPSLLCRLLEVERFEVEVPDDAR